MKSGRKPRGFNTHKVDKEMDEFEKQKEQKLGPSIVDLPMLISLSILLRLPTKRLLVCRCVCKTWRNIISDPHFAKLHFLKSEAFPLVRPLSRTHISRNLYLVEPPEHSSGFEQPDCCDCYGYSSSKHHFHMKLETKLKIPLRNAELAMNSEGDANVSSNSKGGVKRKRCIKLKPKEHKLNLVNSCNGFLCLSEPSKNDPVVVCNPITGEFINLPVPTPADLKFCKSFSDCGLGFSPKTNQYKVIRMFDLQERVHERVRDPITGKEFLSSRVAEIHTLGTESWKMIGVAPLSFYDYKLDFPSYLNGALHWLLMDHDISDYIASFNFDEEIFRPVPPPPLTCGIIDWETMKDMSLGAKEQFRSLKFLKIRGVKSKYQAIAYTPSFISLNSAVVGDNLAILNVTSRCAGLKLQGETKALFLIEEGEDMDSGFNLSSGPDNGITD
ncbi:hypothetical protein Vadar_011448 [Vaccinium darrowii]|uniref:Uncharacterized protein n=1 Tax=Vaccinium darrowii TaxID=229202 RepID=A0ACB7ZBX7_9ERIC|nr:hypothetical protein Vadar_011448 [Vaccinium darrowii]